MWADDDRDLLWLMTRTLGRDGIVVKAVDHAPTCGEIVREHPAVLFLDVDLGDASGADVCDRLKKDRLGAAIPVVLVSAQSSEKLRATARACGADGYITKPFLPDRIVALAKQYAQLQPGGRGTSTR
jgi:two-component system OmpR family response regulator